MSIQLGLYGQITVVIEHLSTQQVLIRLRSKKGGRSEIEERLAPSLVATASADSPSPPVSGGRGVGVAYSLERSSSSVSL